MDISTASLDQMLGASNVQQQHDAAILKLSNDQIKQDGANVMTLLQSVPAANAPYGSLGHNLDVTA